MPRRSRCRYCDSLEGLLIAGSGGFGYCTTCSHPFVPLLWSWKKFVLVQSRYLRAIGPVIEDEDDEDEGMRRVPRGGAVVRTHMPSRRRRQFFPYGRQWSA
jgi:hypothetical protein